MFRFSNRELEVLRMMLEGVKSHKIIAENLGIKDPKQVSVHLTNARRKVINAKHFYQNSMKQYKNVLFPERKYKGVQD